MNHTDYDLAGRMLDTIDPRGIKSGTFYDMLGRAIEVIGAWDGTQSPSAGNSTNQITTYAYNGNNNVITMTAEQPTGGSTPSQTTAYVYGVGSAGNLFSNDVIGVIDYPDKTTGAAATIASEQQSFSYDFQDEKIGFTDQNGTQHQYNHDVLGRLTADIITGFGSGVDQSVKSLYYNFNDAGLPFQQTSYNDTVPTGTGSDIVNQVQDKYNGYSQLVQQWQDHSGSVNTSTSPSVQYAYSTSDNNSRHLRAPVWLRPRLQRPVHGQPPGRQLFRAVPCRQHQLGRRQHRLRSAQSPCGVPARHALGQREQWLNAGHALDGQLPGHLRHSLLCRQAAKHETHPPL